MILGITGGVGAGKSSVLAILEKEYNAKLILADEVGRELMQPIWMSNRIKAKRLKRI